MRPTTILCVISAQQKVVEVDVSKHEVVYDLLKSVVDASRIKIPYFRAELWKIKEPRNWLVDDSYCVQNIPNNSDDLERIAKVLYAYEDLDEVLEGTQDRCISIVMYIRVKKDLESISVPERMIWCAIVGQDQEFQVDIAKCRTKEHLMEAIARDGKIKSYAIGSIWRARNVHMWPVNDRLRTKEIPSIKDQLQAVSDPINDITELEENLLDDQLRKEHISVFVVLKQSYAKPSIPFSSTSISPVWCAIGGHTRLFQVDIGSCKSVSDLFNTVKKRSGISFKKIPLPALYKISNPNMWPIDKVSLSGPFLMDDYFLENAEPIDCEEDTMDYFDADFSAIRDNLYLALQVSEICPVLPPAPPTLPAPDWHIWCAIGERNYVCRINIKDCDDVFSVTDQATEQTKLRLINYSSTLRKIIDPKAWPVGDVARGIRKIPVDEEQLNKVATRINYSKHPSTVFDRELSKDYITCFITIEDFKLTKSNPPVTSEPFVDRDDIRKALKTLGFGLRDIYVFLGRSHVASVFTHDGNEYFAKYLSPGRCGEIDILNYLRRFPSRKNHTPDEIIVRYFDVGAIYLTPWLKRPVKNYEHLARDLLSIAHQLFEGVAFLHAHRVAHMDLKCSHVIYDDTGRLWIVDYDIAQKLMKADKGIVKGYRGTAGHTAPEVGPKEYNAYAADVWAAGMVVLELCELCPEHEEHDFLSSLSKRLMDVEPSKRPSMQDAAKEVSRRMKQRNDEDPIKNVLKA